MKFKTEIKDDDLDKILLDLKTSYSGANIYQSIPEEDYKNLIDYYNQNQEVVSIIGIDIYKYSKYSINSQNLIPYIFNQIYNRTIIDILNYEPLFFNGNSPEELKENFIETGDGGFQILDSPLHSIIFALFFESNLRLFNSDIRNRILSNFTGPITVRYCVTSGNLFKYNKNFFGPAIIKNARIIAKDSLNRFLIDDSTHAWFLKKFGGIESLLVQNIQDIIKLLPVKNVIEDQQSSLIFKSSEKNRFLNIHCLKLESINMKGESFDIFDLYLQIKMEQVNVSGEIDTKYVISIGNLNTSGI